MYLDKLNKIESNNPKKNIIVIGLIDNIGGREIEVRTILKSLSVKYNVKLVSLYFMTKNSEAIKGINCSWTNIYRELNESNFFLKLISLLVTKYHKRKTPSYFLVDNKISRLFFNFNKLKINLLKKEIDKADAVLYCGTLHLNLLNEIIKYCNNRTRPIVLRTTGKIKSIPKSLESLVSFVNKTLVHSNQNTFLLKKNGAKPIEVVDQTSIQELNLLNLPITEKDCLIYGYIGRFSNEKGILELLKIFNDLEHKLIVAGSGPLKNQVERMSTKNIKLLNIIAPEKISDYFKEIDVLIIPSFEEAGPLVGVEAMAAGKIIISTRVGAMMDRLCNTKNNFWFDINEKETLIKQIDLLNNKSPQELLEIRRNVRAYYIENYSLKKISNRYIEVFDKILN